MAARCVLKASQKAPTHVVAACAGCERKSASVEGAHALFIDDSHRERADVAGTCGAIAIGPESLDLVEGIL